MVSHSVADARNHLSELIDKAIEGEDVVITRHGAPVAVLRGVVQKPGPITDEELEWLEHHRVKGEAPLEDAATLVRRMRDEDWR
jgi:prevent-host-death family protein